MASIVRGKVGGGGGGAGRKRERMRGTVTINFSVISRHIAIEREINRERRGGGGE